MDIKVKITIREMLDKSNDFDGLCGEIGLNPWCMNEGLATGDEIYELDFEVAKKYGLIREGIRKMSWKITTLEQVPVDSDFKDLIVNDIISRLKYHF